ncbi:MAG TPA: hypothetical protein VG206_22655 [Terriglobia bacterium]|nr:hypothetical protein [Terriglobia bacterium]
MKKLAGMICAATLCLSAVAMYSTESVPTGPIIVARRAFKNQTGNIPVTTLFTPAKGGTYRISVYYDTASNPDTPTLTGYYTDDFASYQAQIVLSGNENGTAESESGQLLIEDVAGTPIQLGAVTNGQGTYNLYVIVEQI